MVFIRLFQILYWPTIILIHCCRESLLFDIPCQSFGPQLLTFLLVAVDGLEGIILVSEYFVELFPCTLGGTLEHNGRAFLALAMLYKEAIEGASGDLS